MKKSGGPLYQRLLSKLGPGKKPFLFRAFLNAYPPLVGAGIKVARIAPDMRSLKVALSLKPWNKNVFGTHFGGSLYAMCDPFYVLLLVEALGGDYVVWDKAAAIRFKKPGRGVVTADFALTQEQIDSVKRELETKEKLEVTYRAKVKNADGEIVAEIDKLISIRKKAATSPGS